ncbi:hypothetical protein [Glycomyces buryatensis]|uniref:Uncharacterized protein n=1 Tax=Glycomyces buryatensis TaxID=2570927 RepID=A0A4S8QGW6_9ACTN|nr:hypothetical protein [Glycomyces buryatensis]THV40629.1 hypothetical protein FAB82_15320 [Glycomyces buryatensis]
MSDRIRIGELHLEHRTVEVTAEPAGTTSTAWLERTYPAPHLALGYVTELDSPASRLCLYRAEWSPELRQGFKVALTLVWVDALASGLIQPREANSALIPIGEAQIDGATVDFVWTSLSDHIQVRFRHLDPNVIGHVVFGDRQSPALVANSHHAAWAEETDHQRAIISTATEFWRERREVVRALFPQE